MLKQHQRARDRKRDLYSKNANSNEVRWKGNHLRAGMRSLRRHVGGIWQVAVNQWADVAVGAQSSVASSWGGASRSLLRLCFLRGQAGCMSELTSAGIGRYQQVHGCRIAPPAVSNKFWRGSSLGFHTAFFKGFCPLWCQGGVQKLICALGSGTCVTHIPTISQSAMAGLREVANKP